MRRYLIALIALSPLVAFAGTHEVQGGGGHTIQDEGTPVVSRSVLNCVGTGITCSDVGGKTEISVAAGGGATISIQENDAVIDAAGTAIDFLGADFDLTSAPAGEGNVTIAAAIARLASPAFTGDPLGVLAAANDNDTSLATTSFVQQEINGAGGVGLTCAAGSCVFAPAELENLTWGPGTSDAWTWSFDFLTGVNGSITFEPGIITFGSSLDNLDAIESIDFALNNTPAWTNDGQCSWDSDDNVLKCGDGAGTVTVGPGAGSGDITTVGDCVTGDCFEGAGAENDIKSIDDINLHLDDDTGGTNKVSILNDANVEVAQINETGTLQIDDVLTSDGAGTSDFDGPVTAVSFTADATTTPTVGFDDSDDAGTDDGSIVVNCPTAGDCDMDLKLETAGSSTSVLHIDTTDPGVQSIQGIDGIMLDYSASNASSTTDGIKMPQNTSCASATAEGQFCWDSDSDGLFMGTGAAATQIGSGGVDATSQRLSMLNGSLGYDASGSVYPEPATVSFTPTNFPRVTVQSFNNTATEDCLWGAFSVPTDYSANPSIVAVWTTGTGNTANVADFEFKYTYVTTGSFDTAASVLNPATFGDPTSVGGGERQVSDLGAPSTSIAADATMLWGFCRDGADGDSIADILNLYDLLFEYDSTLNE